MAKRVVGVSEHKGTFCELLWLECRERQGAAAAMLLLTLRPMMLCVRSSA